MANTLPSKKVFIHGPELEQYPYPESCPFKTSRAGKVHQMLTSMGLLAGSDKIEVLPKRASFKELSQFHTPDYLEAMQRANVGEFDADMLQMNLGTWDCPVFRGMYDYASLAAGATITGAKLILKGEAQIAFNPSGGYHHAFSNRASGFCYINDVVLGCMTLANAGNRTLFLDIDVHHSDGVQAAFYDRNDVMTISLHQDGRSLFPGTGYVDEIGTGEGRGYTVNLPMPIGTYDAIYMKAFREVVLPLIGAYHPDVLVLEAGADTLVGDPLAGLAMTNNVFVDVINSLRAFDKPILTVGGGGYNIGNTVYAWVLVWMTLCGEQMGGDLTAGMGGMMLNNMNWAGGASFRDRVPTPSLWQQENVDPVVNQTIEQVKQLVFGIHGI